MKKIKNFLDEMKDRIFVQQRSKKFREKIVKNGGSIKDTVSYGLNMCSIPGIVMGVSALIMLELIAYGSGVYVKEKTAALDNIKSFEILFESQLDDLKSYIIFSKDLELYKNESEAFGSKIDKKLSVLKKELSEGEFNSLNDSYIKYKSKINDGFDLHEEVSEYKFIYDNIPFDLKSFSYYLDQKFSVWLSTIDDAVKYDSKINANLNYEKSEVEVWLSKWSTKDKKLQKYLI